jgi:hypothetical protein
MPAHHAIEMRFIRNPNSISGRTDDVLRITKLGENSVRAVYTEISGAERVIDSMVMSYQQFIVYVYRLFFMLTLDDDPFVSVQLFIPCYPTILLKVANLHKNINIILEMLASVCYTWPSIGRPQEPEAATRVNPPPTAVDTNPVMSGAGGAFANANNAGSIPRVLIPIDIPTPALNIATLASLLSAGFADTGVSTAAATAADTTTTTDTGAGST